MFFEIPPTAGLPLRFSDLLAAPSGDLAEKVANWLGVEALQLECSGSAALVVALTAMHRLSGRRKVVVPAYTCPLVAIAVAQCGLQLVLCDTATSGMDMDPVQLTALCDSETLAVMPTHLGGRLADVAMAKLIAHSVGAWVIEDAAQAMGACLSEGPAGAVGDVGFYSLAAGKGLTLYEGGLLHARDPTLRTECARISAEITDQPGWERRRALELIIFAAVYRPAPLSLAYGNRLRRALRRGNIVDAVGDRFPLHIPLHHVGLWRQGIGCAALPRLGPFLAKSNERAHLRAEQLRARGVTVLSDRPGEKGVWPFLWLVLRDEMTRDRVLARLWKAGLGVTRLFIHALPDYNYLKRLVPDVAVPAARALAARGLTISNSPWLTDIKFGRILSVLEESHTDITAHSG